MTKEFATKVYEALVTHAGAPSAYLPDFVGEMTSVSPTSEWRFGGLLGFGGKYRTQSNKVDSYPEDETPGTRKAIKVCNEALKALAETKSP